MGSRSPISSVNDPVLGRFRAVRFLGKGGFGSVWKVEDPLRPDEELALKVLESWPRSPRRRAALGGALAREFRLAARVRHPVLVEPLESGFIEEGSGGERQPYVLSQFVPGEPLMPRWAAEELEDVAVDLLSALDAIHAAGWRHGDIQPRNILVTRPEADGARAVHLLDFGLAQELSSRDASRRTAGVPIYLAPEVLRGKAPDHRADLYALGVVLFECLRGSIEGKVGDHLLRTHQGDFFDHVQKVPLPGGFAGLLRGLLQPDPRLRVQSGAEAIDLVGGQSPGAARRERPTPSFEVGVPVGGEGVVDALAEGIEATKGDAGRLTLVLVEGAEGLGKTRWIQEAMFLALSHGVRCLSWPVARELAEAKLGAAAGLAWQGTTDRSAVNPSRGGSPGDRLAGALLEVLTKEPTLLGVDDLDRLDPGDQEVLRSLVERALTLREERSRRRRGPALPVLVLSASPEATSGPLAATWRRFASLPWASSHELRPWSEGEVGRYLDQALVPRRDLGPSEEALRQEAAGSPRRWQLLLRALFQSAALRLQEGVWVTHLADVRRVELPGERQRFLGDWSSLGALARDALTLSALWSDPSGRVPLEVLPEALDRSAGEIRRALVETYSVESFGPPDDRVSGRITVGPRLGRRQRTWVLRRVDWQSRATLREALAAAPSTPRAERILQELRRHDVALEDVLEAALDGDAAAERLLSFHARRGRGAPRDRSVSALRLAEALHRRGELDRARPYLRQALAMTEESRDRSWAALLLAEAASASGDVEEADRHFQTAQQAADEEGAPRLLFSQAVHEFRKREWGLAEELARRGAEEYAEIPAFHNLRGTLALVGRGDLRQAEGSFRCALNLATRRRHLSEAASAATNFARVLQRSGREAEAATLLRKAAKNFEKAGIRSEAGLALGNLGTALRRQGDYEGSLKELQRSLTIFRELGDRGGMSPVQASLGILMRELGLVGSAQRHFAAAEATAREAGEVALRRLGDNPVFLYSRALVALEFGRLEEALELGRRGRRLSRGALCELETEALLLEVRLLGRGQRDPEVDLGTVLLDRSFHDTDAVWLSELASRSANEASEQHPESGETFELRAAADAALRKLAASSRRAAFHACLVDVERGGMGTDALRRACENLLSALGEVVTRDDRRRALVALCRHAPGEPVRERARGALGRVVDEAFSDLAPEHRDGYRRQPGIQKAMDVVNVPDTGDRSLGESSSVLREVFRFTREILLEHDIDVLLRKIVDAAMALTGAERGFLALRGSGGLRIKFGRTDEKDLKEPESQLSHTILERTLSEGVARVTTDALEDVSLRSIASVEDLGLRSVICVPLVGKRSTALGALYLDNSFEKGVFGRHQLELVESFCIQAVLAWTAAEKRRERERLLKELREAKKHLETELSLSRREEQRRSRSDEKEFSGIVGDSLGMREVFRSVEVIAPTEISVLITGESGSGKELVARALYRLSGRADRPFVAENCGAVPSGLLESVLFGHVKGAYTGAHTDRRGLFEMAHQGTLFLDEIAELPTELQTRLLRVLQEGEVRPLGSQNTVKVDVRVIAATNRDIRRSMAEGKFREDLYYRLQGAEIHLPSLRERPDDLPLLVEHFLRKLGGDSPKQIRADAMERLARYPWPGNVRELENEIRRALVLAPTRVIGVECLSPQVREGVAPIELAGSGGEPSEVRPLKEVERQAILNAMSHFEGHRANAARALGICRSTLYLKLKEVGFE